MRGPRISLFVLASLAFLSIATLASVSSAAITDSHSVALFAKTNYWDGFADFWTSRFKRQDSIVMAVLGIGAVCLFIITRAKWKK